METFNLYMDEISYGENGDGPGMGDIQFRIVPGSMDDGKPEVDAILAGLDLYDIMDLRNALQELIDVIAIAAIDPAGTEESIDSE
jgi:hypothetical protein